jgi:hypothetical protein
MQYVPPLVFSSTSLLDPALTAIISWIARIESLPSWYCWVGGFIVMSGVGIISFGEKDHPSNDEDVTKSKTKSDDDSHDSLQQQHQTMDLEAKPIIVISSSSVANSSSLSMNKHNSILNSAKFVVINDDEEVDDD